MKNSKDEVVMKRGLEVVRLTDMIVFFILAVINSRGVRDLRRGSKDI